jgi:hypothetical protein
MLEDYLSMAEIGSFLLQKRANLGGQPTEDM